MTSAEENTRGSIPNGNLSPLEVLVVLAIIHGMVELLDFLKPML